MSEDNVPMNKQALVEQTLDTIQRTAMKIAALPAAARDDALDVAHRAYANAMHDLGQDNVASGSSSPRSIATRAARRVRLATYPPKTACAAPRRSKRSLIVST